MHRLPYVASGAHPDVTLVRTELLSIGVDEVRELVRRSAMSPTLGRWQVIVIEDADRITERGADALLKSIEEPAPRTVWILCAPTADDVVATVRSRCRLLTLRRRRPAVARLLEARDGVEPELAAYAARASQGHIGRARLLARSEVLGTGGNRFCRSLFSCMGWARAWRSGSGGRGVHGGGGRGDWGAGCHRAGEHSKRPWDSARRGRSRARHRLRSRSWKNSSGLAPNAFSGMRLIEHLPS